MFIYSLALISIMKNQTFKNEANTHLFILLQIIHFSKTHYPYSNLPEPLAYQNKPFSSCDSSFGLSRLFSSSRCGDYPKPFHCSKFAAGSETMGFTLQYLTPGKSCAFLYVFMVFLRFFLCGELLFSLLPPIPPSCILLLVSKCAWCCLHSLQPIAEKGKSNSSDCAQEWHEQGE